MTKRREFLNYVGGTAAGVMLPFAWGDDDNKRPRERGSRPTPTPAPTPTPVVARGVAGNVVVVGGGMAGASAAKFLRLWGGTGVQVTLIEREAAYTSNILSNLVLNGSRDITSLRFTYDALQSRYGVNRVTGDVTNVDPVTHRVTLADGRNFTYDRLVLAPGIAFDTLPGLETPQAQALVPHAWVAGPQTVTLRDQLRAMRAGGVFVMTIPKAPYRCPPGPYERACVVADWLRRNKPGSKVIVLDENLDIVAENSTFTRAFNVTYAGTIEYRPNVSVLSVDANARALTTSAGVVRGDVLNVIPPHRAADIVSRTGLVNVAGRWAGVDVLSYESTAGAGIHVIGDSNGSTQPKAGHIGNQEAKVCADAIVRIFGGEAPDPSPVTNSACFSPISANTASWLTAVFAYDPATRSMKVVPGASGEAPSPTQDNFQEMGDWFRNLMSDTFA